MAIARFQSLVRRTERIVEALVLIGADSTRIALMRPRLDALAKDVEALADQVTAETLQHQHQDRVRRDKRGSYH